MTDLQIVPRGPFSLAAAMEFAGSFPAGIGGGGVGAASMTLAFPVEGTDESVALELWQDADGTIRGRTDAPTELRDPALHQAARSLSLDHDGSGWPRVGERDPVIGALQREHRFLRPVCFYSAYEAAASFVIGHRISRRQTAAIKRDLSAHLGDRPTVSGVEHAAFPRPARLLELGAVRGLTVEKVQRLHSLGHAALDGRLDTDRLRSLGPQVAIRELQTLPGVGPFTANAVFYRGCGVADGIPDADEISREAIRDLYDLPDAGPAGIERISEAWRPYRMWAVILLRVGWGRRHPGPVSYRRG